MAKRVATTRSAARATPARIHALARAQLAAEANAVSKLSARVGSSATPEAKAFARAVDLLATCARERGTVLVTGLGKSGLIGAKIAATFASLGVPSHFIHPTEAAHGDLGNFREQDVCIAISYSGQTEEVVSLASVLRQDDIDVIAICRGSSAKPGAARSGLEAVATVTLPLGAVADDHLSPAPMASTTATLALGDALALCTSRVLGVSEADFARRHPGGSLGELMKPLRGALRFLVGQNLHPQPDSLSLAQALRAADVDGRRPGALLLIDPRRGTLTGILTDGDLRRIVLKDPALLQRPARELMTRTPSTLRDTDLVRDAVRLVRQFRRDEVPVVDKSGRPVGLLDVQDLVALRLVRDER